MPEPMTEQEMRQFLLATPAHTGKIATTRPNGRPHVTPIWFDLEGDTLLFTTWHDTVKASNLQENPAVALCVDDEQPPFSYVIVEGTATIEREAPDLKYWATRISGRYIGQDKAEAFGERNAVPGEWLVRVKIEKMIGEKDMAG